MHTYENKHIPAHLRITGTVQINEKSEGKKRYYEDDREIYRIKNHQKSLSSLQRNYRAGEAEGMVPMSEMSN